MGIEREGKIGKIRMKNRTVRSATWMNMGTESGQVSNR